MTNRCEEERQRILKDLKKILDELFPHRTEEHDDYPHLCYRCKQPMCQVTEKGKSTYLWCPEPGCHHREDTV